MHAEINCLYNAGRDMEDFRGMTIYSTLMPCNMCAGAIVQFGITKVIVGESKNFQDRNGLELMQRHGVEVVDLDQDEAKFLRTRNTELNHIQQAVARYAMAQPGIKFLLITDSRNTLETPGSGRLIETILALYDIETAKNMLELSLEREDISISGYTANREAHRGSRAEITTLVNGRWIRDSNLAYAVEQAYDKTLPPHRHPISVINIEIPGHLVDINAHPTKREVRFKSSNKVFGAVRQAVEQALLEHSPIHRIQPPLRSQGQTSPRFSPLEARNPARLEPGPSLSFQDYVQITTRFPPGAQGFPRRNPQSLTQGYHLVYLLIGQIIKHVDLPEYSRVWLRLGVSPGFIMDVPRQLLGPDDPNFS